MNPYTKPLPGADPLAAPYWEHLRAHRLSIQRCTQCGHRHFPPSPVCPACLSDAQEWEVVSGRATLLTWATFHRAYWPSFKEDLPYDVCVVRLDEGPFVVSNFAKDVPLTPRLGLPLQVVFDDVSDTLTLPRFTVVPAAAAPAG
ncbi:MAG: Zn-ribbon domain-containing OB-fold protein [Janthinobacterium lividum]